MFMRTAASPTPARGSSVANLIYDCFFIHGQDLVDVTNFSPKTDYQGSRENLHLVEREV
jgi:hypothetical protein